MDNNVAKTGKPHGNKVMHDLVTASPIYSDNPILFQIFFLNQDENQNVEVLETDEIDVGEILQRLKMGETVFIKYKNQPTLKSHSTTNTKEERNFWYFTHC